MMMLLIGLAVLAVLVALYVVWLRPMLRKNKSPVLETIEPVERALYLKSETLLWNRFKAGSGALLGALLVFDWNAVTPIIPEKYRPYITAAIPILIFVDGLIGDWLRKDTTLPIEVVAMRTDAPPEVKAEAAAAKVAVDTAKAAVVEAKAA